MYGEIINFISNTLVYHSLAWEEHKNYSMSLMMVKRMIYNSDAWYRCYNIRKIYLYGQATKHQQNIFMIWKNLNQTLRIQFDYTFRLSVQEIQFQIVRVTYQNASKGQFIFPPHLYFDRLSILSGNNIESRQSFRKRIQMLSPYPFRYPHTGNKTKKFIFIISRFWRC